MAAIRYTFQATGQREVAAAFKSISQSAREAAAAAGRPAQAAERGAQRSAQTTARAEAQRWAAVQKTTSKIEREFAKEAKAAERAGQSKIRTEESVAAKRERIAERSYQRVVKGLDLEARAAERTAARRATAEDRVRRRAATNADRSLNGRLERIGGIGKDVALTGAAAIGGASAGLVGAAARDSIRLQEAANRISINSRGAGQSFVDPSTLRKEFEATAMATPGVGAGDVAEAVQKFVTMTGDLATARKSQGAFATVASATGASSGDVAEAAASLSQQLGIKSPEQMKEALAALTFQGKSGAFELKDAASLMPRMASAAAGFGVRQDVQGVKTVGGLAQIARQSTGSGEEATTAVENIFTKLKTESDALKKEGINVYNKDGSTRDVKDVLVESISKLGGSNIEEKNSKIAKIFDVRAARGLNPLVGTFQRTFQGTKGSEEEKLAAATKAVREQLEGAINVPGAWAEVQKDAARAQTTSSAQLSAAWEALKTTVGDQLTPKLVEVVGKFAKMATDTNAVEGLVTVFVALAEAAELAADGLRFIGLLKPKEVTPAEKLKKAQSEFDKFNAELETKGLDATPADIAKRDRLADAVGAASGEAWQTAADQTRTPEQMAAAYAAAQGGGTIADIKGGVMSRMLQVDPNGGDQLAKMMGSGLGLAGQALGGGLGGIAGFLAGGAETGAAGRVRQQYQDQQAAGETIDADSANKALATLQSNAENAAGALAKIIASAQATILG